ncbi:MAG TPA: FAD-dependent oxidoreductase [Pseudolabrys sp.]|jgi:3-phenylpropionate/trans-cinnamate dioxygenase ferredoxin reductase subunit
MSSGVVIIGAGQGGYQVAASLREAGYGERITVVGDEPELPYQRPPLSKAYLLGDTTAERLLLRPQSYYEKHTIDLVAGTRVTGIDRAASRVALSSGTSLAYDHLVIATGAHNRMLPVDGATLDGVMYMRTLADADAIKEHFAGAANIVVAGAGFIGLELAAVASKLGKSVHVIEPLPRCMSRAVSSITSQFFGDAHAQFGVKLLANTRLQRINGSNGRVASVTLSDGRDMPADLVLVGIGIVPADDLAKAAGLPIANGIVVDAQLVTADLKISAIGDCAAFPDPYSGTMIRLESVQNAVDQGRCVAKRIAGHPAPYAAVPWFWSDQRDLKLQMVGLTAGCDRTVLRGNPADRAFSVFCFRGDTLLGIESVNKGADHMFGRRLLAAGESVTPDEAADPSFDLKARLARLGPGREAAAG